MNSDNFCLFFNVSVGGTKLRIACFIILLMTLQLAFNILEIGLQSTSNSIVTSVSGVV